MDRVAACFARTGSPSSAGGVLIKSPDGMVLGAVGVSGDVSDKDEVCAVAGIYAAGLVPETGDAM